MGYHGPSHTNVPAVKELAGNGSRGQRNAANDSWMSRANAAGCSSAAKWPPHGICVHRATLNARSTHSRGGLTISLGNLAKHNGGTIRSPESNRSGWAEFSL